MENPEGEVRIAVVGKYQLLEAYKSLNEALAHGGIANRFKVKIKWVDAEDVEKDGAAEHLSDVSGILVPGGFGNCRRPLCPGKQHSLVRHLFRHANGGNRNHAQHSRH